VLGSDSAATLAHTLIYGLALLGMFVLLLALNALFVGHAIDLGALGVFGYLTAFLGTLLVAGDWWFEAFAVPAIAAQAPGVLRLSPGGSLLAGAVAAISFYTAGWVLFGVAILRARVFPRPAALLMILAGLAGPLAMNPPGDVDVRPAPFAGNPVGNMIHGHRRLLLRRRSCRSLLLARSCHGQETLAGRNRSDRAWARTSDR
jgi:hypothetical protein